MTVLVDNEDYDRVLGFNWLVSKIGNNIYVYKNEPRKNGRRRQTKLHRYILSPSKDKVVDHKDHNGLNNQKSNLRICTRTENCRNRIVSKQSRTGFLGVWYHKKRRKFIPYVRVYGKKKNLGYFKTAELAAKRRDEAATIHYGEFANLNFKP